MKHLTPGILVTETREPIRPITEAPTSITAFVGKSLQGPVNQATAVRDWQTFDRLFGGLCKQSTMSFAVWDFFTNGGSHALIIRLSDEDYPGSRSDRTGIYALDHIEVFNLLCIPPASFDTDIADRVWREAARYCEDRCAMLVVDPPMHWISMAHAVLGMNAGMAPASPNAVLYFPRIQKPNPLQANKLETFVPCGAMAGIISRTDQQRGVWKSPAGRTAVIRGIESLAVTLSNGDNNQLNALGANCLRTLPGIGQAIWGARTLESGGSNHEWRYLAVRRTALHIRQSLTLSLQWTAFEDNSETLWSAVRQVTQDFLGQLHRNGALQGQSARDAFFVRCDQSTTTLTDILQGRLNLIVGVAPSKPAEFLVIKLQLKAHDPVSS